MHELAIADAILSVALAEAADRRVARVGLRIGHLRQVVPSSLHFNFELVARNTLAQSAELEIESVPVRVRCEQCSTESRADAFPLACRQCGDLSVAIVQGDEMLVEWIETEE